MRFPSLPTLGAVAQRLGAGVLLWTFAFGCGGGDKAPAGPGPNRVTSVNVTPATAQLTAVGDTLRLVGVALGANGAPVQTTFTWASADQTVATVDASGLVRSVGIGTARISASAGGVSGGADVTVRQMAVNVTVTPASDSVFSGRTLRLTAAARDRNQNAIPNATIVWSVSDTSIAGVDGSGLVTGRRKGTVTIRARVDSATGSAQLTVRLSDLVLARDTSLSGTARVEQLSIPVGVTLRLTGDAELLAEGSATIAGAVVGDCVRVDIQGESLTVRGTVSNTCSNAAAPGKPLLLRSVEDMVLDSATVTSSGDIEVSNVEASVSAQVAATAKWSRGAFASLTFTQSAAARPCRASYTTIGTPGLAVAGPAGSPNGGNGQKGANRTIGCSGDLHFIGTKVYSQGGGPGGDGRSTSGAVGGSGGAGGDVVITSAGKITFEAASVLHAQPGGRGGNAISGQITADAKGGDGGAAGLVKVTAAAAIDVKPAGLTIVMNEPVLVADVPNVKSGGHADATGARGNDATATSAAIPDGASQARGGAGGSLIMPSGQNVLTGGLGTTGSPTYVFGKSGDGGAAIVTGGDGGNGNQPFKPGARGGSMTAHGGKGGGATLPMPLLALTTPGDGGLLEYHAGFGGLGFSDCLKFPWESGGQGGDGGQAFGQPGDGGFTHVRGAIGKVVLRRTANGNAGGTGAPPGAGGGMGIRSYVAFGVIDDDGASFKKGPPGSACQKVLPATVVATGGNTNHENFGGYSKVKNVRATGGSIIFEGDAPWITVTGTNDSQGNFTATGIGTYAGFSGIDATFTGKLILDATGQIVGLDGTKEIGKNGKLPGGQSIIYSVKSP